MRSILTVIATILAFVSAPAHAYVGPGLGLGVVVTVLMVVLSVFVAVFAIFWYPIKRMLRSRKEQRATDDKLGEECRADGARDERRGVIHSRGQLGLVGPSLRAASEATRSHRNVAKIVARDHGT